MSQISLGRPLAAVLLTIALFAANAAPASATLPVPYSFAKALTVETSPNRPAPGANDWSCKPSAAHPRPVVLVHGTLANMSLEWNSLSPLLKNNGYCVFSLNYGQTAASFGIFFGIGDITHSGLQLSAFVDRVLAATGAPQVDLVGHSQGGLLLREYLNRVPGAPAKVHAAVGIAPDNHGTTSGKRQQASVAAPVLSAAKTKQLALFTSGALALTQQSSTSPFITALNATPETQPGVEYTVISTKYDEIVTPYKSQQLNSPTAHNIVVQSQCPLDLADHLSLVFDSIALRDVLNALDPAHAQPIKCKLVLPWWGDA